MEILGYLLVCLAGAAALRAGLSLAAAVFRQPQGDNPYPVETIPPGSPGEACPAGLCIADRGELLTGAAAVESLPESGFTGQAIRAGGRWHSPAGYIHRPGAAARADQWAEEFTTKWEEQHEMDNSSL